MRVLFLGDTHGNLSHIDAACQMAKRVDVGTIVQVGDFGINLMQDRMWTKLNRLLERHQIDLYWLDGNHEHFDLMHDRGAATHATDMVPMSRRITYLPRGYAWDWDGVRFMSLGGAYSIDIEPDPESGWPGRVEGESWFSDELITDADVERAQEKGNVDVLLTHDAPDIPPILDAFMQRAFGAYKQDPLSTGNRLRINQVYETAQPKLHVHGHMHFRYNDEFQGAFVVGLSRDGTGGYYGADGMYRVSGHRREWSWALLDTDHLDSYITDATKGSAS